MDTHEGGRNGGGPDGEHARWTGNKRTCASNASVWDVRASFGSAGTRSCILAGTWEATARRVDRRLTRRTSNQAVSDIIRTTLGPRSMLKMLLDAQGGTHLRVDEWSMAKGRSDG